MTEMHLNARYIANAVPGVPVLADADNGYGTCFGHEANLRDPQHANAVVGMSSVAYTT